MAGTLPAAARPGRAARSGAGGRRRAGRAARARAGRALAAALRRAAVGAVAADLVHGAVGAGAVDVELAAVALDDHERVAVAAVAAVVDEHPVARPADDLGVPVALHLLRLLALRGGRRGGGPDRGGVRRGERGAGRARG